MKNIYLYKSPDGRMPFLEFMSALDEKARKKLEYALKSMEISQGRLTEPQIKHFSIERYRRLYEVREKARVLLRVIFAFDSDGNVILLHPLLFCSLIISVIPFAVLLRVTETPKAQKYIKVAVSSSNAIYF